MPSELPPSKRTFLAVWHHFYLNQSHQGTAQFFLVINFHHGHWQLLIPQQAFSSTLFVWPIRRLSLGSEEWLHNITRVVYSLVQWPSRAQVALEAFLNVEGHLHYSCCHRCGSSWLMGDTTISVFSTLYACHTHLMPVMFCTKPHLLFHNYRGWQMPFFCRQL